jgi:hypothetical protein
VAHHPNIEQLNAIQKNTIGEVLDIRFEPSTTSP